MCLAVRNMFARSISRQALKISTRGVHVEARIASLGITLPEPTGDTTSTRLSYSFVLVEPKGNYLPYVRNGNTVFLAGLQFLIILID